MAEPSTLARPYAKAAFQFARQSGSLQSWYEVLQFLAAVVVEPSVDAALKSSVMTADQKAQLLVQIGEGRLNQQQANFISVVAQNKRLTLLPLVFDVFEKMKANEERTIDVDVRSAFELSGEALDRLAAVLSRKLDRQVKVLGSVDRSLLGGVVIHTGDMVIDASVRGRLATFAETMKF